MSDQLCGSRSLVVFPLPLASALLQFGILWMTMGLLLRPIFSLILSVHLWALLARLPMKTSAPLCLFLPFLERWLIFYLRDKCLLNCGPCPDLWLYCRSLQGSQGPGTSWGDITVGLNAWPRVAFPCDGKVFTPRQEHVGNTAAVSKAKIHSS